MRHVTAGAARFRGQPFGILGVHLPVGCAFVFRAERVGDAHLRRLRQGRLQGMFHFQYRYLVGVMPVGIEIGEKIVRMWSWARPTCCVCSSLILHVFDMLVSGLIFCRRSWLSRLNSFDHHGSQA